jgi:hypothetical protein
MRGMWVTLILLSGCASAPVGIVPTESALTLTRSRYVLPPEPDLPSPRSLEEQRRLEAEWPPVRTLRVSTWQPSWLQAERRPSPRRAATLPPCRADLPAKAPCRGAPGVHAARPIRAAPVVVRVDAHRQGGPPTILLEMR